MADVRTRGFEKTRPGDHIVFIYEDTAELATFAAPFIKEGLDRGERCIYVFDDLELAEVTEALAAGGVEVNREIQRGALVLMNAEEYSTPPPFDPLQMVELNRRRVREAGSPVFSGPRIAAEMTWAVKTPVLSESLAEYEAILHETLGSGPAIIACMYRRGRFPPAILQQVIRSHSKAIAGDYVCLNLSALFQELTRTDLQWLLQSASERRAPKGGFYYHQGDPATEVFVLTTGKVKTIRIDPNGRSTILRIVTPTEPFGGVSALGGTPRLASAQALEDSRALVWDVPTILRGMMSHPAVSLNAVYLMARRVVDELDRAQDLTTSPVERRLARLLLRLAQSMGRKTPHGIVIEIQLSGEDLAALASTTPYTVSRILAGWKRLGIAGAQRDRILVQDQKRIAAIADLRVGEDLPKTSGSKPPLKK
jgi:CRP/FNR family transcriptional regulator, nitrogen oxide reductase regulator